MFDSFSEHNVRHYTLVKARDSIALKCVPQTNIKSSLTVQCLVELRSRCRANCPLQHVVRRWCDVSTSARQLSVPGCRGCCERDAAGWTKCWTTARTVHTCMAVHLYEFSGDGSGSL